MKGTFIIGSSNSLFFVDKAKLIELSQQLSDAVGDLELDLRDECPKERMQSYT